MYCQMDPAVVLSLRDLTIGYDNKIIMQNINIDVHRGEIISILGQSGCGKSTLLKNIIGIYTPIMFARSFCTTEENTHAHNCKKKNSRNFPAVFYV